MRVRTRLDTAEWKTVVQRDRARAGHDARCTHGEESAIFFKLAAVTQLGNSICLPIRYGDT